MAAGLAHVLTFLASITACSAALSSSGRTPSGISFNPCARAADAPKPQAGVYFNSNGSMYGVLRAEKALAFLRGVGAFAPCAAATGAKPCALVDIGAGEEAPRGIMKRMGLQHVAYLPVDYKARSADTIVCNLNNIEFPHAQLGKYNVVGFLFLGSLEYVIHRWALVASLAMYPNAVSVIHYSYGMAYYGDEYAWVAPLLPQHFSVLVAPFNGTFYPDTFAEFHVARRSPGYGAIMFNDSIAAANPALFMREGAYIHCRESCDGIDAPCYACSAESTDSKKTVLAANLATALMKPIAADCRDSCTAWNASCLACLAGHMRPAGNARGGWIRPALREGYPCLSAAAWSVLAVAGFGVIVAFTVRTALARSPPLGHGS
ncbi:hypothetical protein Rsub_11345 [Raphidocelis subcapitata]|uniref:Methyltransferase type 11 domain-containing protein n=1 Tax=Raphidocelis subcapitata TaxID=307507 RepID=A0A2V0PE75_9CHLO|nr:hypothetical protein Rsub_11345 [Raphidocelis subcapitata]|eukprot:GBF97819.1 hypothetical protein Rsub_11345 [Raphidocelis subcapitata]